VVRIPLVGIVALTSTIEALGVKAGSSRGHEVNCSIPYVEWIGGRCDVNELALQVHDRAQSREAFVTGSAGSVPSDCLRK
jgi:hypothetical protein